MEHPVEPNRLPVLLAERDDVLDLELDDVGDADAVRGELAELLRRTGAEELLVATTVHDDERQAEADERLTALVATLPGGAPAGEAPLRSGG